jgi:protein SCO1/2
MSRLATALALVLLAALTRPVAAHRLGPDELGAVGFDQQLGARVPLELAFRDESGQGVTLASYLGVGPIILTLNYFNCPNLCPLMLEGLANSLNEVPFALGQQYRVLSVSVDPRETPALAATARTNALRGAPAGATEDWHFLTGDQAAIESLAEAVGFRYAYDADQDQYAHPAGLVVLTDQGRVARYLYGLEYAATDLRLALLEATGQQIGGVIDRALLLCYHYDPASGSYSPAVLAGVRAAGLATMLGLGALLVRLGWRDLRVAATGG